MSKITFDMDPKDPAHIQKAIAILNELRGNPLAVAHAMDFDLFATMADAPPTKYPYEKFGSGAKKLFEKMSELIARNESCTLEEAAAEAGISVDAARAHIRNAGRTLKARNLEFPFFSWWDAVQGRKIYAFIRKA